MLASDGVLRSATLLAVAPALAILAAALVLRRAVGVATGVLLLGSAYAMRLVGEDTLDSRAPFAAAALFAIAELSYWSLEQRAGVVEEAGGHLRRLGVLAGLTLGALVLGLGLLALVDVLQADGAAVYALGVAAAVTALGLLVLASRRPAG